MTSPVERHQPELAPVVRFRTAVDHSVEGAACGPHIPTNQDDDPLLGVAVSPPNRCNTLAELAPWVNRHLNDPQLSRERKQRVGNVIADWLVNRERLLVDRTASEQAPGLYLLHDDGAAL